MSRAGFSLHPKEPNALDEHRQPQRHDQHGAALDDVFHPAARQKRLQRAEQKQQRHRAERGIVRERRDLHEHEQLRQPPVEHAHERKTDPIDHHAAHAVRARRIAGIREHLPLRVLRDDVRIIRDRHAAAPVVRLCGDDAARVQQRIRDGVLARPADHAGHIQLQNRGRHGRSLFVSFPRSAHSSTPPDAPHASTAAAAGPIYTPSYDGNCAILKNGTSVCLNVNGGNIAMLIDVNGPKGPNVWGRDLRTYTHSVKGKTGYDMSSNGIISLNQTPIEDNDSDPCEGKTCGCGDLPACETDPCVTDNNSLACCRKRTITGTSDKCCQYSEFSSSTICTPAPKTVSAYCALGVLNRSYLPSSYSRDDFFWQGPWIRISPRPIELNYGNYQSISVKGGYELNGTSFTVTCTPSTTISFADEAICLGPEVSSYELQNTLFNKSCTLYVLGVAVDSVSGNAGYGYGGMRSLTGILIKK